MGVWTVLSQILRAPLHRCSAFRWLDNRRKRQEEEERHRIDVQLQEEERKREETMKKLEERAKFGRTIVVSNVVGRNHRDPEVSPYRVKPTDFGDFPNRQEEYRLVPSTYIKEKSNQNVLISGASGAGKSVLACYLLSCFDSPKLIISFKANDEYLKAGYPVADVSKSRPEPVRGHQCVHHRLRNHLPARRDRGDRFSGPRADLQHRYRVRKLEGFH